MGHIVMLLLGVSLLVPDRHVGRGRGWEGARLLSLGVVVRVGVWSLVVGSWGATPWFDLLLQLGGVGGVEEGYWLLVGSWCRGRGIAGCTVVGVGNRLLGGDVVSVVSVRGRWWVGRAVAFGRGVVERVSGGAVGWGSGLLVRGVVGAMVLAFRGRLNRWWRSWIPRGERGSGDAFRGEGGADRVFCLFQGC